MHATQRKGWSECGEEDESLRTRICFLPLHIEPPFPSSHVQKRQGIDIQSVLTLKNNAWDLFLRKKTTNKVITYEPSGHMRMSHTPVVPCGALRKIPLCNTKRLRGFMCVALGVLLLVSVLLPVVVCGWRWFVPCGSCRCYLPPSPAPPTFRGVLLLFLLPSPLALALCLLHSNVPWSHPQVVQRVFNMYSLALFNWLFSRSGVILFHFSCARCLFSNRCCGLHAPASGHEDRDDRSQIRMNTFVRNVNLSRRT